MSEGAIQLTKKGIGESEYAQFIIDLLWNGGRRLWLRMCEVERAAKVYFRDRGVKPVGIGGAIRKMMQAMMSSTERDWSRVEYADRLVWKDGKYSVKTPNGRPRKK